MMTKKTGRGRGRERGDERRSGKHGGVRYSGAEGIWYYDRPARIWYGLRSRSCGRASSRVNQGEGEEELMASRAVAVGRLECMDGGKDAYGGR